MDKTEPTIDEAISYYKNLYAGDGVPLISRQRWMLIIRALEEMREREKNGEPWYWVKEKGFFYNIKGAEVQIHPVDPSLYVELPILKPRTWDRVTLGEVVEFMDCTPGIVWCSRNGWRDDTLVSLGESVLRKKEPDPLSTWRSLT